MYTYIWLEVNGDSRTGEGILLLLRAKQDNDNQTNGAITQKSCPATTVQQYYYNYSVHGFALVAG